MRYIYTPGVRRCGRPGTASGEPDVDLAAVERLIDGDTAVAANWWELDTAIVRLQASGLSTRQVAERIGVTRETVLRHNKRRAILEAG